MYKKVGCRRNEGGNTFKNYSKFSKKFVSHGFFSTGNCTLFTWYLILDKGKSERNKTLVLKENLHLKDPLTLFLPYDRCVIKKKKNYYLCIDVRV